jgi:hypothetical protein
MLQIFVQKEYMTMKSKRLIQVLVVFMLIFSSVGGSQSALASSSAVPQTDTMVVNRTLNIWDATYFGFVTSNIFENWHFDFTEPHEFIISVSPITGGTDFVPLLTLFDSNGAQLAQGTSSLTSTQGAGSYSIQVQPATSGGIYALTLREVVQTQPSASVVVMPTSINAGESALVTVSLNNVPAEGYTSAEFTCGYNASLIEVSNITAASLFGSDPAVAINGPQNGVFIIAIAGSNGSKATTDGTAFTFNVTGLQAGQSSIDCVVRVSMGNNVLTQISSTGGSVTVTGSLPTATFTPTPIASDTPGASPTPTSLTPADTATPTSLTPADTATPSSTPVASDTPGPSATPTSLTPVDTATPTASFTPVPSDTPTFTSTPIESPTSTFTSTPVPTSTPLPNGTLTGQVLAGKPVTVSLYDGTNTLVAAVSANSDGTFNLTAPAGTYTIRATASGFLSAQGSVAISPASSTLVPTVTLLAGDIDGNNVIDQFDALTIGMSYNTNTPAAADLNNDNTINVLDLELLAQNYRATGPSAWGTSYP